MMITLHLTHCDPLENANNKEVKALQVEEMTNILEQASTTEDQVEQASTTTGHIEQASTMEGQLDQASTTEGQVESASTKEGQLEQASTTEGQVESACTTEGQLEQGSTMESPDVFTGSATVTVLELCRKKKKSGGPKLMPDKKMPKRNCSYHTRLEAFPIRSVVKERVKKGSKFWLTGSPVQYVVIIGNVPGSQRILSK